MSSEVILVVDDEPLVLSAVARSLQLSGYMVLLAASSGEALEIGRQYSGPIHLMVSDVLMPGLNGPAMAERFAAFHPETRCLFIAGLADHPVVRDRILGRGYAFLAKPFMPLDLVARVRLLLSASAEKALTAGV